MDEHAVAQEIAHQHRRGATLAAREARPEAPDQVSAEPSEIGQQRVERAVVLDEVASSRLENVARQAAAGVGEIDASRSPDQVDDVAPGLVPAFPAGARGTQAEVHFFVVEEVALVERSN